MPKRITIHSFFYILLTITSTVMSADYVPMVANDPATAADVNNNFDHVLERISALEATQADHITKIANLEDGLGKANTEIINLKTELAELKLNSVLGLNGILKYEEVDGKATVWIEAANLQVVNGLLGTESANGLGNIIIGYNENYEPPYEFNNGQCNFPEFTSKGGCEGQNGGVWGAALRSGSHYLVTGKQNGYTYYGGIIAGKGNHAAGSFANVLGGDNNAVIGAQSVVSGGNRNVTFGENSSISGGFKNQVGSTDNDSGSTGSISGGAYNKVFAISGSISGGSDNVIYSDAVRASILGGRSNKANGYYSAIGGGLGNDVIGEQSFIGGGAINTTYTLNSNISGGISNSVGSFDNQFIGIGGSILGGFENIVVGDTAVVSGGEANVARGESSVVVGGSNVYVGNVPNMSGNKSVVCGKNSTNSDNKISCDSN